MMEFRGQVTEVRTRLFQTSMRESYCLFEISRLQAREQSFGSAQWLDMGKFVKERVVYSALCGPRTNTGGRQAYSTSRICSADDQLTASYSPLAQKRAFSASEISPRRLVVDIGPQSDHPASTHLRVDTRASGHVAVRVLSRKGPSVRARWTRLTRRLTSSSCSRSCIGEWHYHWGS